MFIINLSLEKGSFPEQLKVAKVIPLHKGGRKADIENWGPISILPIFSKILEKVVHKRLYNFLQMKRFLSQTHFAFHKDHSTTHSLSGAPTASIKLIKLSTKLINRFPRITLLTLLQSERS